MKRISPVVAAVLLWLWTAHPVSAQSALKRLEELIRSNRAGAAAESQPTDGQNVGRSVPSPSEKGVGEKGYVGAVVDDQQDRGRGVRILEVRPASPADIAGLRAQDLITSVGGARVRQLDDLADIIETRHPGEVLEFKVLREQGTRTIEVTLGRPPNPKPGSFEEVLTPAPEPRGATTGAQDLDRAPPATLPELAAPQCQPTAARPDGATPKSTSQDGRALLEALKRRIEQLERRVEELERRLPP